MSYRHHTTRCRHGFAIGLIRCEACSGKWKGQQPEPKPPRWRPRVNQAESDAKRTRTVPPSYRGRI